MQTSQISSFRDLRRYQDNIEKLLQNISSQYDMISSLQSKLDNSISIIFNTTILLSEDIEKPPSKDEYFEKHADYKLFDDYNTNKGVCNYYPPDVWTTKDSKIKSPIYKNNTKYTTTTSRKDIIQTVFEFIVSHGINGCNEEDILNCRFFTDSQYSFQSIFEELLYYGSVFYENGIWYKT
jgi:hypothetical protein